MINLSNKNGLIHWTQKEIRVREMLRDYFVNEITEALHGLNKAWTFHQCEAPILEEPTLEPNYYRGQQYFAMVQKGSRHASEIDISPMILRAETTKGSYLYADYLQKPPNNIKLPLCVWQYGKSFRREQDQPTKFMRLKEFYQLEFQCIYSEGTKCDYLNIMLNKVDKIINYVLSNCYLEDSPRCPAYSSSTTDIVTMTEDIGRKMELCSVSARTDYSYGNVLEIAIGMDRCVYKFLEENNE